MRDFGDLGCQAAAFVYKNDDSQDGAWADATGIPDIRVEHHRAGASFTRGLTRWNAQSGIDPSNAFLAVYAHMGEGGMGPVSEPVRGDLVTWEAFDSTLPRGLATLWLVGCRSEFARSAWADGGPLRSGGLLVCTTESIHWRPLLAVFADEVSIETVTPYDEMPALIRGRLPREGDHVEYWKFTRGSGWAPLL